MTTSDRALRLALAALLPCLLSAAWAPRAAGGEEAGAAEAAVQAEAQAAKTMAALSAARETMVKVIMTPRWDEDCLLENVASALDMRGAGLWQEPELSLLASRLSSMLEEHYDRRTSVMSGVILGPGFVAVADDSNGYDWRLVGKIEVEDRSGRRWPAEPHGLLTSASAVVFKYAGDGAPKGLAFREDFRPGAAEPLIGASLSAASRDPEKWEVSCGPWRLPYDGGEAARERLTRAVDGDEGYGGGVTVLFDSATRPAAVSVAGIELEGGNAAAWSPPEMLRKGLITFETVRAAEEAARAACLKCHRKVRFEFRVGDEDEEEEDSPFEWRARMLLASTEGGNDVEAFGLAIAPDRLLVPRTLQPLALRRVDKISVLMGEEWKPARFVATLAAIDGMVIELPGGGLEPPAEMEQAAGVELMRPFVFASVRELLGRVEAQARDVRCLRRDRGYADRLRMSASDVPPGALLFGTDGRLAGICIRERRERQLSTLAEGERGRMSYYNDLQNMVPFSGLMKDLAAPADRTLPTWRPMDRQEEKRLVWLGVEYDPIDRELAKRLKLEGPTRGGAVGVMVSAVYTGSPAEKLGIAAQDVLLRLEVEGLGDPLPLLSMVAASGAETSMRRMSPMMMGEDMAGRSWRPQSNYLTRLFTEIGPGPTAKLTWHSHARGAVTSGSFRLDYGPVDFDSAEPHKDKGLGLTVKPLTYEVRHALSLAADAPGVIISKVEPGSSAQLARLMPYILITHVQGEAVNSVEAFRDRVAKLRAEKADKVKLQVSAMGRSRFADLQLGEEGDAADE